MRRHLWLCRGLADLPRWMHDVKVHRSETSLHNTIAVEVNLQDMMAGLQNGEESEAGGHSDESTDEPRIPVDGWSSTRQHGSMSARQHGSMSADSGRGVNIGERLGREWHGGGSEGRLGREWWLRDSGGGGDDY